VFYCVMQCIATCCCMVAIRFFACCNMLERVAVCCSVLQCVVTCSHSGSLCFAICCNVLQYAVVSSQSASSCVAAYCNMRRCTAFLQSSSSCVAVCCGVLLRVRNQVLRAMQCVAVRCSVFATCCYIFAVRFSVCCRVLQCVAQIRETRNLQTSIKKNRNMFVHDDSCHSYIEHESLICVTQIHESEEFTRAT